MKVLSMPVMVRNGAILSVDYLRTSIINTAPFFPIYFRNILEFSEVPGCSTSIVTFGLDQGQNVQE